MTLRGWLARIRRMLASLAQPREDVVTFEQAIIRKVSRYPHERHHEMVLLSHGDRPRYAAAVVHEDVMRGEARAAKRAVQLLSGFGQGKCRTHRLPHAEDPNRLIVIAIMERPIVSSGQGMKEFVHL